jgi:hypothetical protein
MSTDKNCHRIVVCWRGAQGLQAKSQNVHEVSSDAKPGSDWAPSYDSNLQASDSNIVLPMTCHMDTMPAASRGTVQASHATRLLPEASMNRTQRPIAERR